MVATLRDSGAGADLTPGGVADLERRGRPVLIAPSVNTEIADTLHISLSTVKTHLASLMAKLGARE